jgi:hypothetical protein
MVHLIDELKIIPGVMGACLYKTQEGVKASNLPGIFKRERLDSIGRQLIKLQSAGRMSLAGCKELQLSFEELKIVAREFEDGTLAFALCEGGFNAQLLQMPLRLLEEEYLRLAKEIVAKPENANVDSGADASADGKATVPNSSKLDSAAQAELTDELTTELALLVGPMAGMIVEDAIDGWQQQNPNKVADLVELICAEVGSAEKADLFRQSVSAIIYKWDWKKE